ncbi:MAG: AAA family ATPase [Lachnospiraceae bacterium]|nr:AAA family ATPase [Lachnospiraceae bacterium]
MFFGRENLIDRLESLFRKRTSSFVTCRGRRRVGKSTLIAKFAERAKARFIKIEGIKPRAKLNNGKELENFAMKLAAQTGCDSSVPANWFNAFLRLDGQIRDNERTVVLLDEISWMAYYDPMFAGMLKSAWDDHFKRHPKLVFVLCGSVSSWIRDNILEDGSFYGRRSLDVVVPELPVCECAKFWGSRLSTFFLDMFITEILGPLVGIDVILVTLISAVLVTILNYVISKIFVFKKKETKEDKETC